MATSSGEKLRFTKEQFLDALCKVCTYPDNPKLACLSRQDGNRCMRCMEVARRTCKMTSLENESIFEGY